MCLIGGWALGRRLRLHAIEEIVTGTDDVLADTLQSARKAAGLTRGTLARRAGISIAEIGHLEAGRLGAFASPERARLVVLAYCDTVRLGPTAALSRLEPYATRQLLVPTQPPARRGGALQAMVTILLAGLVAWQAATFVVAAGGRPKAGDAVVELD